jgi:hypothetical protein
MILFTILLIALVLTTLTAIFVLGTGTAIGIVIFADLIVCIFLLCMLIKHVIKK